MGTSLRKKQVVVYLPPGIHRRLKAQAARLDTTISALVEAAVAARLDEQRRSPLPAELEPAAPDAIVDALAAYGAPLWSSGQPVHTGLAEAILLGLVAARGQPSLLLVLPIVVHLNRERLTLDELRAHVSPASGVLAACGSAVKAHVLPALGMLLELTAEVTGDDRLHDWADQLWQEGAHRAPTRLEPFFTTRPAGTRYLALAAERTPDLVRRWGFVLATPLDDFRAVLERHCRHEPRSSAARS